MSQQELQARLCRQYAENAAWRLLRADHAPLILAFVADLFGEENEVAFGRARVALATELERWREQGLVEGEVAPGSYLRDWIRAGWLRELDDLLSKTDACEVALRFCLALEHRDTNATASHLRIVQDAVRDLAVALSPNPEERLLSLEARKAALQREIDDLEAGVVHELAEEEQRERMREVYQLAAVLTGDFRRVEDEIRELDQSLRVQMIESAATRGEVLLGVLEKEALLARSDAGRAFESFFHLLCDQNRSIEFRAQLQSILARPAAQHLTPQQSRFLAQLMRELTRESERVFRVRRRTEESLRAFVESGSHLESRAVGRLLGKLERVAVRFKEFDVSLRGDTGLCARSGSAVIRSPDSIGLRMPEAELDTRNIVAQQNLSTPSDKMLDHLQTVKVLAIAGRVFDTLAANGPLTIEGIIARAPVTAGLEELIAHLRIAQAIGATRLEDEEEVIITGENGERLRASIPGYLLSAQQFPAELEELAL